MSGILDLIDGTLTDCTISPDAMRWAPEPVSAPKPQEALPLTATLWRDRQGRPLSTADANRLLGDWDYKTVGRDTIRAGQYPHAEVLVSTVWLGVDHAFGWGPPIMFETMVFAEGTPLHEQQWRWGTEEQAIAGHAAILALVAAVAARKLQPSALDARYHQRQRNRRKRR